MAVVGESIGVGTLRGVDCWYINVAALSDWGI